MGLIIEGNAINPLNGESLRWLIEVRIIFWMIHSVWNDLDFFFNHLFLDLRYFIEKDVLYLLQDGSFRFQLFYSFVLLSPLRQRCILMNFPRDLF